jgi:hypothetical protein
MTMSSDAIRKLEDQLEFLGELEVRRLMSSGAWGDPRTDMRLRVEDWLRAKEVEREIGVAAAVGEESAATREAVSVAREANAVARESNAFAREANAIARSAQRAAWVAAITAIIAAVTAVAAIIMAIIK